MNKKGFLNQFITVLIIGVLLIAILLFVFVGGAILPIMTSTFGDLNTQVQDAMGNTGDPDIINAADVSFNNANKAVQNSEWIFFTLMIMVFIAFIALCYYSRVYPFLAFVWVGMMIVIIFISIFLTSAYQDMSSDPTLSTSYNAWGSSHFYLQYMPHIFAVIGVIGGIIMFALPSRDQEAEAIQM
jgi:hypothetical protein